MTQDVQRRNLPGPLVDAGLIHDVADAVRGLKPRERVAALDVATCALSARYGDRKPAAATRAVMRRSRDPQLSGRASAALTDIAALFLRDPSVTR